MNIRFTFEAVIGTICLLAILFFGSIGLIALALFVLFPVVVKFTKCTLDEREKVLFYKAGNLTFGITVMALWVIYKFSAHAINGNLIGEYWYYLSISTVSLIHGVSGLIVFKIS